MLIVLIALAAAVAAAKAALALAETLRCVPSSNADFELA